MSIRHRVLKSASVKDCPPLILKPKTEDFLDLSKTSPILKHNELPTQRETKTIGQNSEDKDSLLLLLREESEKKLLIAQAKAEQILSSAEEEAENIRREARKEAEEIKNQALQEVDAFKSQIAEEVRNEILPVVQEQALKILEEANNYVEIARSVLVQKVEQLNADIVHLAIKIAERILRAQIKITPNIVNNIIENLLKMPPQKEDLCLRVSQDDAELFAALAEKQEFPCKWTIDNTLNKGDFCLEHAFGLLDARIETQLQKLEDLLLKELADAENAGC